MIIKYTFNDNDFTQIIEKYLDEFGPFYSFSYPTLQTYNRFKDLVEQYNDYNDKYTEDKDLSKEEFDIMKKELLTLLKISFTQYISNIKPNSNWRTPGFDAEHLQEDKEYILNHIKISLVKSIPDQWENGEIVYYIPGSMKYITI